MTAEDGHLYERSAIEEWIRQPRHGPLKSPCTNEPMGPRLTTAVQARNAIEKLVECGVIGGDMEAAWRAAQVNREG